MSNSVCFLLNNTLLKMIWRMLWSIEIILVLVLTISVSKHEVSSVYHDDDTTDSIVIHFIKNKNVSVITT